MNELMRNVDSDTNDTNMDAVQELILIAEELNELAERGQQEGVQHPLGQLKKSASEIGNSWSRSWIGYQSRVYYSNFQPPPREAYFDLKRGLSDLFFEGSRGDWIEYSRDEVIGRIIKQAESPDTGPAFALKDEASRAIQKHRMTLLSILDLELSSSGSSFLSDIKARVSELAPITETELVSRWRPKQTTGDRRAVMGGIQTPPHLAVLARIYDIENTLNAAKDLGDLSRQSANHVARMEDRWMRATATGTRVFIGHGRSLIWRELKDFIEDRLGLQVDEFNRVSAAGMPTSGRLAEMLDSAGMAFVVMTGEDEQPGGQLRARENVVHEAGLFQGRLGFTRAIILLEDGCKEFSNIAGLGQIRFQKGNLESAFEEIRMVLEREGLLSR